VSGEIYVSDSIAPIRPVDFNIRRSDTGSRHARRFVHQNEHSLSRYSGSIIYARANKELSVPKRINCISNRLENRVGI
jgi:hypothetical protein